MTTTHTSPFGDLLRRYRLAAGLSQEALAERARLSASAVAALERGRRKTPRPDTLALLADALGLTPDDRARLVAAGDPAVPDIADAPPALTAARDRASVMLPAPPNPLIGREREQAGIVRLLQPDGHDAHARLVTLTGPGGVGKTRLALAAAAALSAAFADGVAFVDLSALRDPAFVAPTIAQGLGLREEGALDARDLLLAHLRPKQMLLVLDNFEQVVEAAPLLGELVAACPRLAALVTSRIALHVRAERRFDVQPLDVPDADQARAHDVEASPAVRLFVARARAQRPDFTLDAPDAAAVAEVCRRLDGVPLAIELAAARVTLLPPVQLLGRLERRLSLPRGGARDLPARQQTLRATIDWSYALLPEWECAIFRRLSVFAGGCTFDAAEVVARGPDDSDVFAGLASLVDRSLLRTVAEGAAPGHAGGAETAEPRFRMLETVREFGLEQLSVSGEEEETRRAHAAYYLALAEQARPHFFGPDQMRWLDRLEREGDNLRVTLAGLRERGDAEQGVQLVAALWRFWYIRCHLGEGRSWLEEFVALPAEVARHWPVWPAHADALVGLAVIAYAQTAYDRAAMAAEQAVAAARLLDDRSNLAVSLNILGGVARYRGDFTRAKALGEECVTVARSVEDRWTLALSLHNLADVARLRGAYGRAAELARESLSLSRALGDRWGIAQALLTLGRIARDRDAADEAEALFGESLAIVRALGHTRDVALVLAGLGRVALARGDHARAVALMEEALGLLRPLGDMIRTSDVLTALGRASCATGDHERAASLHRESLRLAGSVGARLGVAENLEGLALATPMTLVRERSEPEGATERLEPGEAALTAEQAARLLGAAAALRGAIGAPRAPSDRADYDRAVDALRATLGDDVFDAAWAEGAARDLDQVVDEVLDPAQVMTQ